MPDNTKRLAAFASESPSLDLVTSTLRRAPMALQTLGDRWTLLILRDAFLGARRFSDFYRLTGAPHGTLAQRLKGLVAHGVLYRNPVGTGVSRYEYRLTGRGLGLTDFALCIWDWEHKWGGDSGMPEGLVHRVCGSLTTPTTVCSHCTRVAVLSDIQFEAGPGVASPLPGRGVSRRRDSHRLRSGPQVNRALHRVIDVFGDRWSSRLLAALFMGIRRFDELGTAIGISTNILSDRLRRLGVYGIVEQLRSAGEWGYHLTPAGLDLFPAVLAIHKWSNRWAAGPSGPALLLRHGPCGKPLDTRVVCSCCKKKLEPRDLELQNPKRHKPATSNRRR